MYIVALFIVMAILLEAVMTVLNSILATIGLGETIKKLPVIGANLTLIVSILMVWLFGDWGHVLAGWGWNTMMPGSTSSPMAPLLRA